jgi:hypothetical protein
MQFPQQTGNIFKLKNMRKKADRKNPRVKKTKDYSYIDEIVRISEKFKTSPGFYGASCSCSPINLLSKQSKSDDVTFKII